MISPASAYTATGQVGYGYLYGGGTPTTVKYQDLTFPVGNGSYSIGSSKSYRFATITTDESTSFNSGVGFYVSYYFSSQSGSVTWTEHGDMTRINATYYNSSGTQGTVASGAEVTSFVPAGGSGVTNTNGYTIKCTFLGSSDAPINRLTFTNPSTANYFQQSSNSTVKLVIPSATLVEAGSSEELQGLQNIADQLANQSNILSAMYGDVMEVLNAIYQRTGDMLEAQNLANSYFNSMINYLNSINTNTSQIYSLLQSQFQLLIATINTASSDIQGAISKQTEDLKTYFDSVFNSAVGTLPDDTDSAQGVIDDAHENDEQYTADALGKFEEISATFQGFDGSVGSGVAVASTLFSRVWSAMGDYVIVYTFPLTLALALVIVGRLSRVHSKDSSKSKGGDDSG